MKKKWSVLVASLLLLTTVLPGHAFAQNTRPTVSKLRYSWYYGDSYSRLGRFDLQEAQERFEYDPSLHDRKIRLHFVYPMLDMDTNQTFYIEQDLEATIGSNFDDEIPLQNVVDREGKTHANATLASYPQNLLSEDPGFRVTTSIRNFKQDVINGYLQLHQAANLNVSMKVAQDSPLPPEDVAKMKIDFHVSAVKHETAGDTTIDPVAGINHVAATAVVPFEAGQTLCLYKERNENGYKAIHNALLDGKLEPYNRYKGKFYDFTLHGKFTGPDAEAMKENYKLTLTGDDANGWVLTVEPKNPPKPKPDPGVTPDPGDQPTPHPDPVVPPVPTQPAQTMKDSVPNTGAAR